MSSVESVRETTDILDQLVDACSIALTRFSEQNGEVEEHTWRKNYPAVKALGEALEGARGRPQVVSAPRRHGKVDEMKQSITLEELAHALFDVEMSEEDWDEGDEPPTWEAGLTDRVHYMARARLLFGAATR